MPYGPERAARRIVDAGAPVVVWIRANALEEGAAVLFGVIAPMLEMLSMPHAVGMIAPDLRSELLGLSQRALGSSWRDAGVFLAAPPLKALPRWQPAAMEADEPWVHSMSATNGAHAASTDERYEALKLVVLNNGAQIDLLDVASPADICSWIESSLPAKSDTPQVVALYADEDSDHQPLLQANILISSVGFLHELRDVALTGALDHMLTVAPLIADKGLTVRIDRAQFCRMYEGSVLSLDKCTPARQTTNPPLPPCSSFTLPVSLLLL